MRPRRWALWALLSCTAVPGARAAEPITQFGVVLLQPSSALEQRVPSIDALAEYISAVKIAARSAVLATSTQQSAAGFIVVAVRPGQRSKVWLDFDTSPGFDVSRQLVTRIAAVRPFEAKGGSVVFALKVTLWGGQESARVAPSPIEWKAFTSKTERRLEVDELIDQVWP